MQTKSLTKIIIYPIYLMALVIGVAYQAKAKIITSESCNPDEASVTLSNTLENIATAHIVVGGYKNKVLSRKQVQIAPGGMKTVCVKLMKKARWLHAGLDSCHEEEAQLFYTFEPEYQSDDPMSSLLVTENEYYPAIL